MREERQWGMGAGGLILEDTMEQHLQTTFQYPCFSSNSQSFCFGSKKILSIHGFAHQLKSQYTEFLRLQVWTETHQLTCSPLVHFFFCPKNHLKQTNRNTSTRKIKLTSVTNNQAVAHKSWVEIFSTSTPKFSRNNLHNCHGFNRSHSQSSYHKDLSLPASLSSFYSFK